MNKATDINSYLRTYNWVLFISTILLYSFVELPPILDNYSLAIYFLLSIQVHFFLHYEKRNRNPFILMLVIVLSGFYFPRFMSLFLSVPDYIGILNRISSVTSAQINHALWFIFVANFFIFFGLIMPKETFSRMRHRLNLNKQDNDTILVPPLVPIALISIVTLSTFAFSFLSGMGRVSGDVAPIRIIGYIQLIFNYHNILLIVFSWMLLYKPNQVYRGVQDNVIISKYRRYVKIIILLLVMFVIIKISSGVRGTILAILLALLYCELAAGDTYIKRKHLVYIVVSVLVAIFIYDYGTRMRSWLELQDRQVSFTEYRYAMQKYYFGFELKYDIEAILARILSRLAYLDFSVDLIRNSSEYGAIINFPHYAKSLIDSNTPGFDVFDVGPAAISLRQVHACTPKGRNIGWYHSDQFSVYGEYYVLFQGWLSLPVFFVIAFMFEGTYLAITGRNSFNRVVTKAFVILTFNSWLNSFGADWIILEITRMGSVLFVILYAIHCLSVRRVRRSLQWRV